MDGCLYGWVHAYMHACVRAWVLVCSSGGGHYCFGWLFSCLVGRSVGRLIGWLVYRSVG